MPPSKFRFGRRTSPLLPLSRRVEAVLLDFSKSKADDGINSSKILVGEKEGREGGGVLRKSHDQVGLFPLQYQLSLPFPCMGKYDACGMSSDREQRRYHSALLLRVRCYRALLLFQAFSLSHPRCLSACRPACLPACLPAFLTQVASAVPEVRVRFTSPHPKDFPDEVRTRPRSGLNGNGIREPVDRVSLRIPAVCPWFTRPSSSF